MMVTGGASTRETSTVLLVEDSWYTRTLMRDVLETAGYRVREAQDGAEALAAYGEEKPDVVLMDLVMPQMGGLEAMSQIRAMDPEAFVIAVSGLTGDGARYRARQSGAGDFLEKPFAPRELLDAVGEAVNRLAS